METLWMAMDGGHHLFPVFRGHQFARRNSFGAKFSSCGAVVGWWEGIQSPLPKRGSSQCCGIFLKKVGLGLRGGWRGPKVKDPHPLGGFGFPSQVSKWVSPWRGGGAFLHFRCDVPKLCLVPEIDPESCRGNTQGFQKKEIPRPALHFFFLPVDLGGELCVAFIQFELPPQDTGPKPRTALAPSARVSSAGVFPVLL